MNREGIDALPVLDAAGNFLGAVTRQSALGHCLAAEESARAEAYRELRRAEADCAAAQSWARHVETLNESFARLLHLLTELRDDEAALRSSLECMVDLLRVRYAALLIPEEGDRPLRFITLGIDESAARRIPHPPRGEGVLAVALEPGAVLRLDSIASHPRSVGFPSGHPPMQRLLAASVHYAGRAFGTVYAADKWTDEPFSDEDEVVLRAFARTLGLVLHSVREKARRRAAEAQLAESQRLEAIGRLAAGVAHEINTPCQFVGDNLAFAEEAFSELGALLHA